MKFKERIEKLLKERPELREDDKRLTYEVYQQIAKENGQTIFIPFNLFKKFPAFETVKRTRAKIQNSERRFLPESELIINNDLFKDKEKKTIYQIPDTKFRNGNLI